MDKKNCWEVLGCGREPGGAKAEELGVCPAAVDEAFDGMNGGTNAGRACWASAGTFCRGVVQGTFAQKQYNCSKCDFFKRVQQEEGLSEAALFKMGYRLLLLLGRK